MTAAPIALNGLLVEAPLCGEAEFTRLLEEMVADEAPRLFAVVHEYGERFDGGIVAWGMAFANHAEVVSTTGTQRMRLRTPERALRMFGHGDQVRAHLVWFPPDATTPDDHGDAA